MADVRGSPLGTEFVNEKDVVHSAAHAPHPRDDLPQWRWKAIVIGNLLFSVISGYDVSNVANVQIPIYEAFGHIELLPWVSLAYSLTNVAMVPLVRKLTGFCELRTLGLVSCLFNFAGTALCGAAPNIQSVIIGRAIMAIGCASMYQIILSYSIIYSHPDELARIQALVGVCFAIGLITGPVVGGAFAENEHATWRWAFYIIIPITALATFCLFFYPSYRIPSKKSTLTHIKEIDWVGCILWIGMFVLFGLGTIFSGPTWPWNSGASISVWALFGLAVIAFMIQQGFSLFTSPERRAFPVPLLSKRTVVLPSICAMCAAVAYGVTLYYTPIYFAFTRGSDPLQAAVRLLPFIGVFIFMIFFSGGLLPAVRYYQPIFVFGAICMLVAGGLQQTIKPETSEGSIMGFEALLAAGLGLMWQIALPISSVVLPAHERLDAAALFNMAQIGGASISIAMAGTIYQNIGFDLVGTAVAGMGFAGSDVRELLSGADSPILAAGNPEILALVVGAITKTILRCFYINIAAGAICFLAACCMRLEALDFKKRPVAKVPELAASQRDSLSIEEGA
ncbi:major facilitator superfamily transporter [Xylariales sp. AK1849]|nr:major facilitator superfamily transporter [Xylariales sp. AK1849]